MVRVPGFEPGFRRWQRPVITTTLHSCRLRETRITFLSVGLPHSNKSKSLSILSRVSL